MPDNTLILTAIADGSIVPAPAVETRVNALVLTAIADGSSVPSPSILRAGTNTLVLTAIADGSAVPAPGINGASRSTTYKTRLAAVVDERRLKGMVLRDSDIGDGPPDGPPDSTDCSVMLSFYSKIYPSAGGSSDSVGITAGNTASYTVVASDTWIHLVPGYPTSGSGIVSYTLDSNAGADRSGTITICGKILTVYQQAIVPPTP